MKALIIFTFFLFTNAFAINELDYKNNYDTFVRPFLSTMQDGYLQSNGLRLHYKTALNPEAPYCLVILRSEPAEKYAEFIYDLKTSVVGNYLNFFVLDHRGQGSSDRMDPKTDMGHVDQFEYYVSDVDHFLNQVVSPYKCKKRFLFAHSMGAGIGLSWVLKNEKYFDGLMISSPMLKIQTKPYSYAVAKSIVSAMMVIGKGNEFALGQKPFNANEPFETNKFTTSKVRFKMTMDLFAEYPQTKLGGVSNRWLYEIMNGTRKVRSSYKKFKLPIHLYRAGTELYSESAEMKKFCDEALQCQDMLLETSKHEVVNDSDDNRNLVLYDMVMFLDHFKVNDL